MFTHVNIGNSKPKAFTIHLEPSTASQTLVQPERFEAMKVKYNPLIQNDTWALTTFPLHRKPIGCKWVFQVKENIDGSIMKYKARLVAKVFHQEQDFDFYKKFFAYCKTN